MANIGSDGKVQEIEYFEDIRGIPIIIPSRMKTLKSRICLPPAFTYLSEQGIRFGVDTD